MAEHIPLISIVVLAYNSASFIEATIDSILVNGGQVPIEIIVIDNGSEDNTFERLRTAYGPVPQVISSRNDRGRGFAGANNSAAESARGELLLFLNDDCEMERGALKGLRDDFAENPTVGIVQCALSTADGKRWESLGHLMDSWGFLYEIGRDTPRAINLPPQRPVFGAKGAAIAVRRSLFNVLGGFDSAYGYLFEETDLCWRAHLLGYDVVTSGRSAVRHAARARYHGAYAGKEGSAFFLFTRNRLRSLLKNWSGRTLFSALPVHVLLLMAYSARESWPNRPEVFFDFVRAVSWNIQRLGATIALRTQIQRLRVLSDCELIESGRVLHASLARLRRHPAMQSDHVHV